MITEEGNDMTQMTPENTGMLLFESPKNESSIIKVMGVGGAGTNAVNHMYGQGIEGVDFVVCNTDIAALEDSPVATKIFLGKDGLGAGNEPKVAGATAEGKKDEIKNVLSHNTKMLFITAGMGGGTGTGAAPVIARLAKEIQLESDVEQILVVAIVTLPFSFEGRKRIQQAQEGVAELRKHVDSILIINNDKLRELYGNMGSRKAFSMADNILLSAAKSIAEIITVKAYVNVDFRDVNTVMQKSGVALMGAGIGTGDNRARDAVQMATTSPLLNDNEIRGAQDVLLYMVSPQNEDMEITMDEQGEIADYITSLTGVETNIIWGLGYHNEQDSDKVEITFIATGFKAKAIDTPQQRAEISVPKTFDEVVPERMEPTLKEPEIISSPITDSSSKDDFAPITAPVKIIHSLDDEPLSCLETEIESAPKIEEICLVSPSAIKVEEQPEINMSKHAETSVAEDCFDSQEEEGMDGSLLKGIPPYDPSAKKSHEDLTRERTERIMQLRKLMSSEGGIKKLERTPAYKLYGVDLHEGSHSSESEASKVSISHLDNHQPIQFSENSFLNNIPD